MNDLAGKHIVLGLTGGIACYKSCELALQQLASHRFPLEMVTTHTFGLKDADTAIKAVGGGYSPDVIHVSLLPWA